MISDSKNSQLESPKSLRRVDFVLPPVERYSPNTGGAIATFTWQMVRRLSAMGHRCRVFTPTDGEKQYSEGEVVAFRAPTRENLSSVLRAYSRVRRRFQLTDWSYGDIYDRRLRRAVCRVGPGDVWVTFNDLRLNSKLQRWFGPRRALLRLSNECRARRLRGEYVWPQTDRVLAVSDYIRRWTLEAYPELEASRVAILNNGADHEAFYPREGWGEAGRGPLRVIVLGRIDRNKGPDLVADAVTRLRGAGAEVELTIVGSRWFYGNELEPNSYERELDAKVAAAGGTWRQHVSRDKVPHLLRTHDVVCVLSRSQEPMSQVVFEAMASGCAVMTSNRGGHPEALGDAGVQVDPDDFDAVVSELGRLIEDPEWLRNRKKASRHRAAVMTWDRTADQLATHIGEGSDELLPFMAPRSEVNV